MEKQQFIFSIGSGLAVAGAGAAVAMSGLFNWSLFWVGSTIIGLTLAARVSEHTLTSATLQPVRTPLRAGNPD